MLNINKINNNKLPLLINSASGVRSTLKGGSEISDRIRVKINKKLIDSSPEMGSIRNVIKQRDFIINDPKTLTAKYNVLKKSVNLLNSIKENSNKTNNNLIKQIITQKITNTTNNNILKSFVLRNIKLTYIKEKKSLPSFFIDNRKKTIVIDNNDKLNQIRINKNYYISYTDSNNLSYKSNNLNSISLLHIISYKKLNEFNNNNNIIIPENSINNKEIVNNNKNLLSNSIIKLIKSSNSTDKARDKMLRSNNKSDSDIKNVYLINSLRRFTNIMTKFSPSIANSQTIFYHFKKSNKVITYPFIYASKIIILSFLSMGCLISRPVFKIVYTRQRNKLNEDFKVESKKKIIVQLFYYVKYKSNFSSFRNLLLKLFANPDIMSSNYKVNSSLTNADKTNLKYNSNINKTELIHTLTQIKKFNNSKGFFARFPNKFQSLAMYLTNLFNSEIQLDLIRLYKPHFDSNILVQELNLKSYDNRFFGVVTNLFKDTYIKHRLTKMVKESEPDEKTFRALTPLSNAYLTGVKVKLGGRSFQQRIVARQTVQEIQRGSLSNTQYKFKQTARFTGKVKRGSYSFTVTLGHTF